MPVVAPAAAQETPTAPVLRRGWLPRRVDMGPNLTGARKVEALAKLEAIERIFQQVPELAQPDSFQIEPYFSGNARRLGRGLVEVAGNAVEYRYTMGFWYPERSKDAEQKTAATIEVRVNATFDVGGDPKLDELGREMYFERERTDTIPFTTQVYERLSPTERSITHVWLTAGGELPWRQASREEYYKALIFDFEGKNGEKLAEFRKGMAKTPYQQWLEGAPQRKRELEEALKGLAAVQSAAEVAKVRKEMEENEREVGERLRKSEGADRATSANVFWYPDTLRAELARMTAAERRMPAVVDVSESSAEGRRAATLLVDEASASRNARRVLTPNYDFWRARRSPAEARSIVVSIFAEMGSSPPPPVVHKALWQAYKNLDWKALNRLLEQQR